MSEEEVHKTSQRSQQSEEGNRRTAHLICNPAIGSLYYQLAQRQEGKALWSPICLVSRLSITSLERTSGSCDTVQSYNNP